MDVKRPRLSSGKVIVDVSAIGLNPLDYRIRRGEIVPFIMGSHRVTASDFSGIVSAVGPGVVGVSCGDEVYGMVNQVFGGTAQDKILVSKNQFAIRPRNVDIETAAAIPLAALTAHQALHDQAKIREGHRVLINGASGGVGTFATQLAHIAGAHVTAVTSFRNTDWMQSLGADAVVDYTQEDFASGNERYDIIFDCYGNRSFADVRSVLAPKGIYISTIPSIKSYMPVLANPFRQSKSAVVVVRAKRKDLDTLRGLVESETLKPIIDSVHERGAIAEAYTHLESKRARGKIVVRM